jgi:hypothetical protein
LKDVVTAGKQAAFAGENKKRLAHIRYHCLSAGIFTIQKTNMYQRPGRETCRGRERPKKSRRTLSGVVAANRPPFCVMACG